MHIFRGRLRQFEQHEHGHGKQGYEGNGHVGTCKGIGSKEVRSAAGNERARHGCHNAARQHPGDGHGLHRFAGTFNGSKAVKPAS